MKITDPDIIKNGEKDLIEALKNDLYLDAVKEVLKKRMTEAVLSSEGGEIVVYNNKIAFKLNFDIHLSGSLMFDRQGNYISESDETGDQENSVFEDYNFDDININETLEEVEPKTLLSNAKGPEIEDNDTSEEEQSFSDTMEEELKIDLPDYGFDDELDQKSEDSEITMDDIIDDDINDILKESREFWELKKD